MGLSSVQNSPSRSKQFEFGASLTSLTSANSPMPIMPRQTVQAPVEIMGLELFLGEAEDDSDCDPDSGSESSSDYDSYAPDSVDLMKRARGVSSRKKEERDEEMNKVINSATQEPLTRSRVLRRDSIDDDSLYSSFANDSLDLHHQRTATLAHDEDDISDSNSSEYEDDLEDSLHYGFKNHRLSKSDSADVSVLDKAPRRNSVQSGSDYHPSKAMYDDKMKRRSSMDNGNMVVFSPDVMITQHINNGGANAAA
ncbi:hypothetical protein MPSEU_000726300 [Mayamaea pseudoterrestris]|nr:hypothetical protein MPSEU_000726300 [Mayamaea pseudoterrestris]